MTEFTFSMPPELPDEFLSTLVAELNNDDVTALALVGSYAHGTATLYSDVDILRFVREVPERTKQYTYFQGRLIGISTRTIEQYRKRFTHPEEAIFVVPGIRESRILLDKEGKFAELQQEAQAWTWEPLQVDANFYAGEIMMVQTEIVHKTLRALMVHDSLALAEMIFLLFLAVTDAVTVQRGILAASGNSYFQQVEEAVGLVSVWTHYHQYIAGIDSNALSTSSLEDRGIAALRLYQETARLLHSAFLPLHSDVIMQAIAVIDQALHH